VTPHTLHQGLDIGVAGCLLGRFDPARLRLVPVGGRGQRPPGQACVQPDIAQALGKLLPLPAGRWMM